MKNLICNKVLPTDSNNKIEFIKYAKFNTINLVIYNNVFPFTSYFSMTNAVY